MSWLRIMEHYAASVGYVFLVERRRMGGGPL